MTICFGAALTHATLPTLNPTEEASMTRVNMIRMHGRHVMSLVIYKKEAPFLFNGSSCQSSIGDPGWLLRNPHKFLRSCVNSLEENSCIVNAS
jgi:hypothetical protein